MAFIAKTLTGNREMNLINYCQLAQCEQSEPVRLSHSSSLKRMGNILEINASPRPQTTLYWLLQKSRTELQVVEKKLKCFVFFYLIFP